MDTKKTPQNFKKPIDDLLSKLKSRGYSRAKIEREFDYSENYLDQILAKGGNKKVYNRLKKLYDDLLQKTSSELSDENSIVNEAEAEYGKGNSQPLTMMALADLAASNREMAEAHKVMAVAHADLVAMLKGKTTGDAGLKMSADLDRRFSDLYMRLAEVGVGKRWATLEEAIAELNKSVVAP